MLSPAAETNTSVEADECYQQFKSKEFCKKWNNFMKNFNWVIRNAPGTFPTIYERMNQKTNTETIEETITEDKNNIESTKPEWEWTNIQKIYENPSSTFLAIIVIICFLCVVKCMCSRR